MQVESYRGSITYSGLENATVVKSLRFVGADWLTLDLHETRGEKNEHVVRFLGIAEKQSSGVFQTPWVYLTSQTGGDLVELDNPYARITLEIIDSGSDRVQVAGQWLEGEWDSYEFSGWLDRVVLDAPRER